MAANLSAVRAEVAAACVRAGRDPASVTIVGVSKTHGFEVIEAAVRARMLDLGENRAQEFVPKAEAAAAAGLTPSWHFIGHLQRNKARQVIPHLGTLHSLDSEGLVTEIGNRWASGIRPTSGTPIRCYLEVNIAGEAQKHGVAPGAIAPLLSAARDCAALEVAGLMTVAPRSDDPEQVRPVFRELRALAESLGLPGLSMGMTDDYPVAIEEGATIVRIGRAIFGDRRG
ncbi:MAG: YggS family pyridoxal phosphate-dependent enzyme [Chloroflexi bacterium]|nr:YggS family pyridoxal phosphate-dependent enzyme [Chloroflexota bacterium]